MSYVYQSLGLGPPLTSAARELIASQPVAPLVAIVVGSRVVLAASPERGVFRVRTINSDGSFSGVGAESHNAGDKFSFATAGMLRPAVSTDFTAAASAFPAAAISAGVGGGLPRWVLPVGIGMAVLGIAWFVLRGRGTSAGSIP